MVPSKSEEPVQVQVAGEKEDVSMGEDKPEEDISRMTYIKAPKDEPANLDMS